MQTRRGSVLGKRSHQPESPSAPRSGKVNGKHQLPTPDPSPKRLKLSTTVVDGAHNKENVPPFNADVTTGSPRTRKFQLHFVVDFV
jgi:cell division control protein 6